MCCVHETRERGVGGGGGEGCITNNSKERAAGCFRLVGNRVKCKEATLRNMNT